ncbi:MAG: hypothetical protein AB7J32_15950 [Pseudonocardia sp.]
MRLRTAHSDTGCPFGVDTVAERLLAGHPPLLLPADPADPAEEGTP